MGIRCLFGPWLASNRVQDVEAGKARHALSSEQTDARRKARRGWAPEPATGSGNGGPPPRASNEKGSTRRLTHVFLPSMPFFLKCLVYPAGGRATAPRTPLPLAAAQPPRRV